MCLYLYAYHKNVCMHDVCVCVCVHVSVNNQEPLTPADEVCLILRFDFSLSLSLSLIVL